MGNNNELECEPMKKDARGHTGWQGAPFTSTFNGSAPFGASGV